MPTRNKLYFASDFHLGTPSYVGSRERESMMVMWLDMIKADAAEVFLMGDIFDFWFEYKYVVPKGYTRFLGKLAEMSDSGIKIYLFKGNHDMWMFDYFQKELGATIISDELVIERDGKKFLLHHGDGLGPGDHYYKFLKKFFRSKLCQWLFARIHPNLGVGIADRWSHHSRDTNMAKEKKKPNPKRFEFLPAFCNDLIQKEYYDYLIFGHRHRTEDMLLNNGKSRYINLGEWIYTRSYAVFDGDNVELKYFNNPLVGTSKQVV
jgi:UDP-2,3-diacylglucosamine hydrolase